MVKESKSNAASICAEGELFRLFETKSNATAFQSVAVVIDLLQINLI